MTRDPVCGMQVDEKSAPANTIYKGAYYAFCAEQCKHEFDRNPERYRESEQQNSTSEIEPQTA